MVTLFERSFHFAAVRPSVGMSFYSVAVFSIQRCRVTVNHFHVRVSSPPKWRVTVATICALWTVAALFPVPSALSNCLSTDFVNLSRMKYFHFVVIFELSVSRVLPLCVIAYEGGKVHIPTHRPSLHPRHINLV
jgi:hypothetical protein